MPKAAPSEGQTFGELTIICRDTSPKNSHNHYYLCRCSCGGGSSARIDRLRSGKTRSCGGCAIKPREGAKPSGGQPKWRHPINEFSREYVAWRGMKFRCYNQNSNCYHVYGGKGIVVCDRWLNSFDDFMDDMGPRPGPQYSVDRIDNNGNYEPSNCRWATKVEQANNTRLAVPVVVNGMQFPSINEAVRATGIKYRTIRNGLLKREAA